MFQGDSQLAAFTPLLLPSSPARLFCPSHSSCRGKAQPEPKGAEVHCSHLLCCQRSSSSPAAAKVWGSLPAATAAHTGQGSLFLGYGQPGTGTVSAKGQGAQTLPCIFLTSGLQFCHCVSTCEHIYCGVVLKTCELMGL